MTLQGFKAALLTADAHASHYRSSKQENYTVWAEYGTNGLYTDDHQTEGAVKVQIDRYTKLEHDTVAAAITAMLEVQEVAYDYQAVNEPENERIRHIWTCEVI